RPAPVRMAAITAPTAYPSASVNPSILLVGGSSVVRESRARSRSSASASISGAGTVIGLPPFLADESILPTGRPAEQRRIIPYRKVMRPLSAAGGVSGTSSVVEKTAHYSIIFWHRGSLLSGTGS